jgi:hypothetical protein
VAAGWWTAGLVEELPKPQRGLWARVAYPLRGEVTVVSWHTPNAAKDGREVKMAAYRAMSDWLRTAPDSVVLGADPIVRFGEGTSGSISAVSRTHGSRISSAAPVTVSASFPGSVCHAHRPSVAATPLA